MADPITLESIQFGDSPAIHLYDEATISCGSDSYPGKVIGIHRVRGGYELDIQEYAVQATEKGKAIGIGHQEWEILWDKPTSIVVVKLRLNGKMKKGQYFNVSIGHARYYYCWEF